MTEIGKLTGEIIDIALGDEVITDDGFYGTITRIGTLGAMVKIDEIEEFISYRDLTINKA